ncbi:MAG: MBL fold metallo-hydrolase [Bilophila wadsworthia]
MSVSVTWYGHSNFKVSCGDVTVFIDPFFTHNPSCPVTWNEAGKPDLVLVTHDHGDHTGDAVAICKQRRLRLHRRHGRTPDRRRDAASQHSRRDRLQYRGTIEVKGVRVTMTQAFHTSNPAPAGSSCRTALPSITRAIPASSPRWS